ncbi:MAG: hypothetical protein NVS3B11_10670 [Collimonas sp.]
MKCTVAFLQIPVLRDLEASSMKKAQKRGQEEEKEKRMPEKDARNKSDANRMLLVKDAAKVG